MTKNTLRIPSPGWVYKGQAYWRIGQQPYMRKNGVGTTLIEWQSFCADCGEPFTFFTSSTADGFQPNRRCSEHASPGKRTK